MDPHLIGLISAHAQMPATTIHRHARLYADLGLDSLDIIDLIIEIEDLFDIEIPDDDYQAMGTVGEIDLYILDKKSCTIPKSKRLSFSKRYQVSILRISNQTISTTGYPVPGAQIAS